MNKHEDDIRDFFLKIRKKDDQSSIPGFEELVRKQPRLRKIFFISLGTAASVLLALSTYFLADKKNDRQERVEVAVIFSGEKQINTQSLIPTESTMNSWKSSSDFLIDDFNE